MEGIISQADYKNLQYILLEILSILEISSLQQEMLLFFQNTVFDSAAAYFIKKKVLNLTSPGTV